MTDYYCMTGKAHAGCSTNFSNVPPVAGGDGTAVCPKCGMPHGDTNIGGGVVAGNGRKMCPKCGLLQHNPVTGNTGTEILKRAYRQGRCVDCNHVLLVFDDQAAKPFYCVRCGRIYDARYAYRHGNGTFGGGTLVRCPKCGGNVKSEVAT